MGGGDLNLKKSWHVGLISNQKKVWEAETAALAERKKIEQVRRERNEERELEEIERLAEASGGNKRLNRVDWMYTGASAGTTGTTEEQESFLLGKCRVDTILKREDAKQLEKAPVVEKDPVKDIASKVALDPLLMIERQRQEALEKAMAVEAKIQERRRNHEDRDARRHKDHKSSRNHRDRENRHHRRERSRSRDRSDKHERSHRRSRSDERSKSPRRRRRSPARQDRPRASVPHSRSNYYREERRDRPRQSLPESSSNNNRNSDEERQAKLAAMQVDASNLEDDRSRRLAALEERDAQDREREDRKRDRGVNFKSTLFQQTESIGLGERLKNGRRSQLST